MTASSAFRGGLHVLGTLLHVPAALALSTALVALAFGEHWVALPFLGTAGLLLALAQGLRRAFAAAAETRPSEAMTIAALAWLVVPATGVFPLVLVGQAAPLHGLDEAAVFARPINALFESMSGFTSTGLTMSARPDQLPRAIQWWRSGAQWIGGLGVVVLALAVMRPGALPLQLYRAEARRERALPSVKSTVRVYLRIYVGFTLAGIVALAAAGVPPWEALNHGLTAVATGGFTISERGAPLGGVGAQIVLMLLMIGGAQSFAAAAAAVRERRPAAFWRAGQQRLFWILLPSTVGATLLVAWIDDRAWVPEASVFQAVSALCTAGFQTADLAAWSIPGQLLLVAAMVLGGAAGSTAGGLKMQRIYLLTKGIAWRHRGLRLGEHELLRHDLDGAGMLPARAIALVESAAILGVIWMGVLGFATLAMLLVVPSSTPLEAVLLEVASAESNVGLSSGLTSADLPFAAKAILIAVMWVGRLEIVPVFVLVAAAARLSASRRRASSPEQDRRPARRVRPRGARNR